MESKEQKPDPKEFIEIVIEGHTYTINFPKTGQLIDIENKKAALRPRAINFNTDSSTMANLLIDTIATFEILCPAMIKDLNIDIYELDLIKSRVFIKAYTREFFPWYNEWIKIISDIDSLF